MFNIRSSRGSTALTTPLVIAISLFFIALLLVFCVNALMPFIWYEKLSSHSLKYIFVMEEYGYLTPDERKNLLNDLNSSGFDTGNVTILATSTPVEYGEPIFLEIVYNYGMVTPALNEGSLSTTDQNSTVVMNVSRQSVSKR